MSSDSAIVNAQPHRAPPQADEATDPGDDHRLPRTTLRNWRRHADGTEHADLVRALEN
jgi:hypothetical protein